MRTISPSGRALVLCVVPRSSHPRLHSQSLCRRISDMIYESTNLNITQTGVQKFKRRAESRRHMRVLLGGGCLNGIGVPIGSVQSWQHKLPFASKNSRCARKAFWAFHQPPLARTTSGRLCKHVVEDQLHFTDRHFENRRGNGPQCE